MIYAQLFATYEQRLAQLGEEEEALSFTFRAIKGLNLTEFVLLLGKEVAEEDQDLIDAIFHQLAQHRPAQYIIGHTYFSNLKLAVDERVLIPRPETEELVDLILSRHDHGPLKVLDIGTGSGAIALALAAARPDWQITALDISEEALSLAKENAIANGLQVAFLHSNLFEQVQDQYDIIVSNPPYIAWEDKEEVGLNVWHSEPHLALFADEAGLSIYRRLAQESPAYLNTKGSLYLEIGYKQGDAVVAFFQAAYPDKSIAVLQDNYGKDRKVVVA